MDEPLSNLDARLRAQMRAEIASMQKMTGITTVYVTHDQVEAMTMGDRIAVMNGGVLQQLGSPRTLYDAPANLFVAGFIGAPAMNFLIAELVKADCGVEARLGRSSIVFPPEALMKRPAIKSSVGRSVVLGIRPEAFKPADLFSSEGSGIAGTIAFIEDLGATLLAHVDMEAADRLRTLGLRPGRAGRILPPAQSAHGQFAGLPAGRAALARCRSRPHPSVRRDNGKGHLN